MKSYLLQVAALVGKFSMYLQHLQNAISETKFATNFSFTTQYAGSNIMVMVDNINDMKLTFHVFYRKFQKSPKSVFELLQLKKLLNAVVVENRQTKYQEIQLMRFKAAKKSLQNNIVSYVEEILLTLCSHFGALTADDAEGLNVDDQRAFTGDKVKMYPALRWANV